MSKPESKQQKNPQEEISPEEEITVDAADASAEADMDSPDGSKDKKPDDQSPAQEAGPSPDETAEDQKAEDLDPLSELLQKLDEAEERAKKAEDRAIRSAADLDNFRRRLQREKEDAIKRTTSSLLEDFLPIWDNFRMGLQAAAKAEDREAFLKGFEMVQGQFGTFLERNGIEEINPTGADFDPNLHECLSQQPSEDVAENTVITTVRAGFRIGQHLIRPASVVISSGPPQEPETEPKETKEES